MTIDEAIDYAKEQQEIFGGKHKEFLTNVAGWLEELKNLKLSKKGFITIGQTVEDFEKKIREEAIDEFAERLNKRLHCAFSDDLEIQKYVNEIAEQMKGSGENV